MWTSHRRMLKFSFNHKEYLNWHTGNLKLHTNTHPKSSTTIHTYPLNSQTRKLGISPDFKSTLPIPHIHKNSFFQLWMTPRVAKWRHQTKLQGHTINLSLIFPQFRLLLYTIHHPIEPILANHISTHPLLVQILAIFSYYISLFTSFHSPHQNNMDGHLLPKNNKLHNWSISPNLTLIHSWPPPHPSTACITNPPVYFLSAFLQDVHFVSCNFLTSHYFYLNLSWWLLMKGNSC